MVWFDDEYGKLAWKVTAEISIYSAQLLGEIADDIVNIDRALRWGFNFDLGPFEAWDAIGVAKSVERMKDEGFDVPAVVDEIPREERRHLVRQPRRCPVLLGHRHRVPTNPSPSTNGSSSSTT